MLAEGTYRAQARHAELGLTDTDKEQVGVEFEIIEGANKGQRLTWYGFFTEATEARTMEALRYAGFLGLDITDLSSLERADVPPVDLVVEQEQWEGKTRARVRWVNRAGGLSMKNAMPEDRKAAFAARVRALATGVDAVLKMKGVTNATGTVEQPQLPINDPSKPPF